ncbi:MAG: glycosyltransferase family 2 protein [Candidatus Methylomirabilales bacterium]
MSPQTPRISVVIPVYNEEQGISPLWRALAPALEALGESWEVLLVDDGSTDGSLREMLSLRRRDPRVRILRFPTNQGQSAAFWCGFRRARGRTVVTLDADLQNDPADIAVLLRALEGADLAIGWRHRRDDPFTSRIASRIANRFRNWTTAEEIHDVGCSLKAFRREVLERLFPFRGMHRFYPTLARMGGFRVVEVKVAHRPRATGRSKYGIWNRLLGPLQDCLAVRWMKRRHLGGLEAEEVPDPVEAPPEARRQA